MNINTLKYMKGFKSGRVFGIWSYILISLLAKRNVG